ncbi:hypothetical protein GQ53DRAFT_702998 [Thozetella sp. PMI_491]|nr:hypothetical protein GQ53DRAFT_702998 [Thozetella sp. PMI_491]
MALELQYELKRRLAAISNSTGGVPLDDAVRDALPLGTIVHSVQEHGESAWSFPAKINATDKDGKPTPYFLKYVAGDLGEKQLAGEFRGMSELYKVGPNFVVKPVAWGKLKDVDPPSHFFLAEYKTFRDGLPDPVVLGRRLGALHNHPDNVSPNGMFGFPIQTYDGARLQAVDWDPSWTSFFSKLVAEAYRQDVEVNGVWPELELVFRRAQSHLIPRLIGELERDGRSVKPTLIHGDLWEGNCRVEEGTEDPYIFDCAAYYGHNEMEMGIWVAERHELRNKKFRKQYQLHCPASEPQAEWEDRIMLYSCKTNFMMSACAQRRQAREQAFDNMVYLIQKYVPWDEQSDAKEIAAILKKADNWGAGGL